MSTPTPGHRLLSGLVLLVLLASGLSGAFLFLTPSITQQKGESSPPTTEGPSTGHFPSPSLTMARRLAVRGNQIVNGQGQRLQLRGFNYSGAEYACIEQTGIFDPPGEPPTVGAVVAGMKTWRGVNAVRIPLNEQCWLGISGVLPSYGGPAYRRAIRALVDRCLGAGFAVILDLHRSAPGGARSLEQEEMPDRDHSVRFWREVAEAYKGDSRVLFDLFNEPFPMDGAGTIDAWACWRDGGCRLRSRNEGGKYIAAGMGELIRSIRATGAENIVVAGGINYAEDLSRWLEFRPDDPIHHLVASVHVYSFNDCARATCYARALTRISRTVPLLAGEVGPDLKIGSDGVDQHCPSSAVGRTGFSAAFFDWADRHGVGYLAWSWNNWGDCWALTEDLSGTPTPIWGLEVRSRLVGK